MSAIHQFAFLLHVAIGSCALIVFWIPVFARKGSLDHKRFGRYFAYAMYAIAASGIVMSSLDLLLPAIGHAPEAGASAAEIANQASRVRTFALFLLSLSILVVATTRHGWLTIRQKQDRAVLRRPAHVGLNLVLAGTGVVLIVFAVLQRELLFMIFGILEVVVGGTQLHYSFKAQLRPKEWWIEHLGGFIGSGIAAYTAFFVFGGSRVINALLPGSYNDLAILFWVAPGVIGGIAIGLLSRSYTRRFTPAIPQPVGAGVDTRNVTT